MRYSGAKKQNVLTGQLEHLVSRPVAVYEAACEEFGDICRKSWLIGQRGVLRRCHNGSNWWQRLIVELSNIEDPVWDEALVGLLKNPRRAPLSPADERAGRFRFSADALARVKEALRADTEDQDASGYAWLLWNASAKTGLQINDLRAARAVNGKLVKETGELLLRALSPVAMSACKRLISYSKEWSANRGEPALYAAAERAWDRATATIPDEERPMLASARHLSLAVWRKDLDDAMLAVLLGEDESDQAVWGRGLHRGSNLEQHRPPAPPRLRERKRAGREAAGFTLLEVLIVLALVTLLASIAGQYFGGQYRVARQEVQIRHFAAALRQVALVEGRAQATWTAAASRVFRDIAGLPERTAAVTLPAQVDSVPDGAYVGLTTAANTANLTDDTGTAVTLTACLAGDPQFAIAPAQLPAGNDLNGVAEEWISAQLRMGGFETVAQSGGVFGCLN